MITKAKIIDYLATKWGFEAAQLEKYSMNAIWDSINAEQRKEYLTTVANLETKYIGEPNMKLKTLTKFKELTHIDIKLIDAVVKQIGGWAEFKAQAGDIVQYGAAAGISGFIYYYDTVKFAENNRPLIRKMLEELANDCGESFGKLLGSFNGLKLSESEAYEAFFDKENSNYEQVYNVLAWFALEEVARSYVDLTEDD